MLSQESINTVVLVMLFGGDPTPEDGWSDRWQIRALEHKKEYHTHSHSRPRHFTALAQSTHTPRTKVKRDHFFDSRTMDCCCGSCSSSSPSLYFLRIQQGSPPSCENSVKMTTTTDNNTALSSLPHNILAGERRHHFGLDGALAGGKTPTCPTAR